MASPEGDGARRPLLLVADDNADVRCYLKELLGPDHDVLLVGTAGRRWIPPCRAPSTWC
ncbi:hypothetical protein SAZ11_05980 [Streptomyces sp. FXJ1.4098]|nr:hypothetical protein [Streptomyces sp. FXJ1.4098]